ncbi:hypothetical protein [Streptomyces mesophilus]|uniref:hypothetical protein n=1 Tax=Streptomyces mesophilus TaxID=1775132 RepID=UPI00331D3866
MSRFVELLGTSFDGETGADFEDVLYDGLDDPRHRARVPRLVALLGSGTERERLLACVALTTWAEPAGYEAVIAAAATPEQAPWYGALIDRKFSVDSTFAQLALAVSDSDVLAGEKGTAGQRVAAFRALVRIADREYFDEKLADQLDAEAVRALVPDIEAAVRRGLPRIAEAPFDLATQLVDLAAAVATVDGPLAVRLARDVLAEEASGRTLRHAAAVVQRSQCPEARSFGEHLKNAGGAGWPSRPETQHEDR